LQTADFRLQIGFQVARAVLVLVVALRAGDAAAGQVEKIGAVGAVRTATLSAGERSSVIARVLAHPGLASRAAGHRLTGIRATTATVTGTSGESRTILTVVLFDHTALEARSVSIDAVTNTLIADEVIAGRPQRSPEELEEAAAIIRQDLALDRLLDRGAVLDGGFIVSDPGGSRRRMIQFKLVTADRRTLIRTITVDLTLQRIAG
jgi:hypothetical protein